MMTQLTNSYRHTFSRVLGTLLLSCSGALSVSFGTEPQADSHGLVEVRTLDQLPAEIASTLRRRSSKLFFFVGGMRANYVLVAFDDNEPLYSMHAMSFSFGSSAWTPSGEMILGSRPHTLSELEQLIQSDDTKAITAKWANLRRLREERAPPRVSPSRRDGPFRELNLSDDEVRAMQAVILNIMPGAILNISGVVSGCLCQDGAGCSAQAWVLAYYPGAPERSKDLELSEISGRWTIGPVQQWYLDSQALDAKHFARRDEYFAARQTLDDLFPKCASLPGPPIAGHH